MVRRLRRALRTTASNESRKSHLSCVSFSLFPKEISSPVPKSPSSLTSTSLRRVSSIPRTAARLFSTISSASSSRLPPTLLLLTLMCRSTFLLTTSRRLKKITHIEHNKDGHFPNQGEGRVV